MHKNLTRLFLLLFLSSSFTATTQTKEAVEKIAGEEVAKKSLDQKILAGLKENKLIVSAITATTIVLAGVGLLKLNKKTKAPLLPEVVQIMAFLNNNEGQIASLLARCFEKVVVPYKICRKSTNLETITTYTTRYKNDLGVYIPTGEKTGLVLALKSFLIKKEETNTSLHKCSGENYSVNRGDVFAVRIDDKNELVSEGYYLQVDPNELDKGFLRTVIHDCATFGKWSQSNAYQPAKFVANILATILLSYIPIIGTSYVGMMAITPASQWVQNKYLPTPAVPYRLF